MQNKRRIFTAAFSGNIILPLGGANANIRIPLNNLESKIRSITWDWYCRDSVTLQPLTYINNTTQELNLLVSAVNGLPLASSVANAGITPMSDNGTGFRFFTPGHNVFDSFYCQNDIAVDFGQVNHDLMNSYIWALSINLEIEIL